MAGFLGDGGEEHDGGADAEDERESDAGDGDGEGALSGAADGSEVELEADDEEEEDEADVGERVEHRQTPLGENIVHEPRAAAQTRRPK